MHIFNIKWLAVLLLTVTLGGCMPAVTNYADTNPAFAPEEFFNGPIKAWGMVQDRTGRVRERFDVDMVGRWDGNVGTLEEDFTYYSDGRTQRRVWTITKMPDGTYHGTASDVKKDAHGQRSGSAMRWKYVLELPVGDKVYDVTLDDWMFQMNDGVLINRSYLKKFGITVADLIIFMQKQ